MRRRLVIAIAAGWCAYIYFGLGWFGRELSALLKAGPGLSLGLLMALVCFVRAVAPGKRVGLRLILGAAGLIFLGLVLSLLTRQTKSMVLTEGEETTLRGARVRLEAVKAVDNPSVFLSRDQIARLRINGRPLEFGVWPVRFGLTYFHTVRFGFAPWIEKADKAGGRIDGYLRFAEQIDERYNKLVPRRPPPRLMLGVGTYPPELETVFVDPADNQTFFLRLEKGEFGGQVFDLMQPDYYLWLTNGRLRRPAYRLMAWQGEKKVFDSPASPGRALKVGDKTVKIGPLRYWTEINAVTDFGLPLLFAGVHLILAGLAVLLVELAVSVMRLARGQTPKAILWPSRTPQP